MYHDWMCRWTDAEVNSSKEHSLKHNFYPKFILQVYLKMTIIFMLEILSSDVWIQSEEIKGSRIANFDCVLLLFCPGYKCSDNHHCFLSKPSRFFRCT